jgi:uncharacterized membrane protein YeaQ/YmgE (transglycosylase-associated protein family)
MMIPTCRGHTDGGDARRAHHKNNKEEIMQLLLFVLIGAIAGWLAGQIMKGRGFGVVGNIVVGVVGAFLGGFLFRLLGFAALGLLAQLITATVGAIILLWIVSYLRRK